MYLSYKGERILCINFDRRRRSIYFEDDSGQPGYSDLRGFEIISHYIPSNWIVDYKEQLDSLSFYPRSWIETEAFWDKFIDDQDFEMIKLFLKERDFIYNEEP